MPGEFQRGRFTAACYRRMDISDAIATSPEDYIAKALQFGMDSSSREDLERRIGLRSAVLFEDTRIGPELEVTLLRLILEERANEK